MTTSFQNIQVLVVEDNPTQSERLKFSLENLGMQVMQCYSGNDAVKLMKIVRPQLIISDIVMSELNDFNLCEIVKSEDKLKNIPFIYLTSDINNDEILKGLEVMADSYILKPFSTELLALNIKQVLDNRAFNNPKDELDLTELPYTGKSRKVNTKGINMLNLLFSSFVSMIFIRDELKGKKEEVLKLNEGLRMEIQKRTNELNIQLEEIQNAVTEIQRSQQDYKELIDNTLIGIFSCNTNGAIVQMNDAFLTMMGYHANEAKKLSAWDFFQEISAWELFLIAIGSEGTLEQYETIFQKSDKLLIHVLINAVFDNEEISLMIQDISEDKLEERKKNNMINELIIAKEKAAQSESVKTTFLANMSDKIMVPLTTLSEQMLILESDNNQQEEIVESGRKINQLSNYLLNLIDTTIDISMMESGETRIKFENCFINRLLIDLLAEFQKKIEEDEKFGLELRLHRDIKDPDYIIKSEPYRLKRVFYNLLTNAIKFTSEGIIEFGYRAYRLNEKDECVFQFYVKDSGKGMTENKLKHIFDRFGSTDLSLDTHYQTGGFGLSLTKSYVELLGGEIWCESEPQKGTEFYFSHPIYENNKALIVPLSNFISTSMRKRIGNLQILMNEKEDDNFKLVKLLLDPLQMNIQRVHTGKELIDVLKRNINLNLVYLDYKSSIVSGLELITEIRRINKNIPILIQFAYMQEGEKEKIYQLKGIEFISKPVHPELLYQTIFSICQY